PLGRLGRRLPAHQGEILTALVIFSARFRAFGVGVRTTLKTLVYTDYAYHEVAGRILSERAFSLFLGAVAARLDGRVTIAGRLSPDEDGGRYEIGHGVEFVALPWYRSLFSPAAVPALGRSLARLWRTVGSVDRVWLLG